MAQTIITVVLMPLGLQGHTSFFAFFFAGRAPFSCGFFCSFFTVAGFLAAGVGVLAFACACSARNKALR